MEQMGLWEGAEQGRGSREEGVGKREEGRALLTTAAVVDFVVARLRCGWVRPVVLQEGIAKEFGRWYSESAVTARIRDARKEMYGGWVVESRKCRGRGGWEYRVRV